MTSPAPPSPSLVGPRPLQLVDGNLQSPVISSCLSPTVPGLSTPPHSANKLHPRRQSSISYYPSDHTPTWDLRSPTTAGPSSLRRTTSLNQRAPARLQIKGDRRSLPTSDDVVDSLPALPERPPLTLTEKHADLLSFIAQKESKCLELRSQLAAHEAELAQLKRKWQRIVSRGMDRAYAQQQSSSNSSSGSNGLLTGAVKDVSRLLAAGLGSDLSPSSSPSLSAYKHNTPNLPLRTPALPRNTGHANTQSTSSVSTSTSSATSASLRNSSVRLSQSSASSLAFDDPPHEQDESGEGAPDSHPLPFKRTSVRVDGGTGIESPIEIFPASVLKAAKLHRRKSREVPAPPSPLAASTPTPAAISEKREHAASKEGGQMRVSKRTSVQLGGIPPAASIPGLGPLASPLASAWMGSMGNTVGKKWEELQKGETFSKSQKRASLLISDAASSLFAALTSPTSSSFTSSRAANPNSPSVSVSSNPFAASLSPLSSTPSPTGTFTPSPAQTARSLLDDDDDTASALGSVLVPDSMASLPPPATTANANTSTTSSSSSSPSCKSKPTTRPQSSRKGSLLDDEDEDEWNW